MIENIKEKFNRHFAHLAAGRVIIGLQWFAKKLSRFLSTVSYSPPLEALDHCSFWQRKLKNYCQVVTGSWTYPASGGGGHAATRSGGSEGGRRGGEGEPGRLTPW